MFPWEFKMMLKAKSFLRTGYTLSFLAIFFIAFGAHLLHPFFHHHEPDHSPCAHNSNDQAQLEQIEASEECFICLFLASVQWVEKIPLTAPASLIPLSEYVRQYELTALKKPYYKLPLSRAPPPLFLS